MDKNIDEMTVEEAHAAIREAITEAQVALARAEAIADVHKLGFSFDPAYGMGGWYNGIDQAWNPSSLAC